ATDPLSAVLYPRSLHDALPILIASLTGRAPCPAGIHPRPAFGDAEARGARARRSGVIVGRCASGVVQNPLRASRQGEEQLLQLLAVQILLRVAQALLHAAGDDREAGTVQCLGDGGELGDHVLAVRALLEHADDRTHLALSALEAVDHRSHVSRVEFHEMLLGSATAPRWYTPGGVLRTPGGMCDARLHAPSTGGPLLLE